MALTAEEILSSHRLVLVKDKEIIQSDEKGVFFLLKEVASNHKYVGYQAYDTIVGKAAAMLYTLLEVHTVYGRVMSQDGYDVLKEHGIRQSYQTLVPEILSPDKSRKGPLETALEGVDDPEEGLTVMQKTIEKMKSGKEKTTWQNN